MNAFCRIHRVLPLATISLLAVLLGLVSQPSRQAHAATTTIIKSCPDEATLRTDISGAASGDTIQFKITGSPCTITLTGGPIVITKDLTLDASHSQQPVTLSGGGHVQVLQVNSGVTFMLKTITITKGSSTFSSTRTL